MSQQWAHTETEAMLLFLLSNKSEIGEAGNFKEKTYTAAAGNIPGQTRSASQVQTKWQAVSHAIVLFELIIHRFQLRQHIVPSRSIETPQECTRTTPIMNRTLGGGRISPQLLKHEFGKQ